MAYGEESGAQKAARLAFSPLRWGWNIFWFIITFAFVAFIILTIFSMVFSQNVLLSYYYDEVTDPLLNTGIGNYVKKGLTYLQVPFSEKKQAELLESYSWKSNIDEKSTKQDLGVKITKFQTTMNTVNTEQFSKIEAVAEGYASTTESTEIEFTCLTENDEIGEIANQNNILSISPNRKEFFTVKCIYDKDLFEIDNSKATDSQKIRIKASYNFITEAYIPIYLLQKDILEEKRDDNEDIFKDIQDKNLNKQDGTVSSTYTKGPVKLVLRSLYTQPYTEEGPFGSRSYYTLDIKFDDNIQWTGNIENIEEFHLLIPEEMDIKEETTDEQNKFQYIKYEDNFKVYEATPSLIRQLNEQCEPKDTIERITNLIEEDCWRRGNIITNIEFSINNAPEEISQTFIRAKLIYKFSDIKQETITFINT